MSKTVSKVIIALDFPDAKIAIEFVDRLDPTLCRLKVGKELFTSAGPEFVRTLVKKGYDVFLDLKYHDIPNTVAKACIAAAELGVWMVDVHASGGRNMLETAAKVLEPYGKDAPLLIAITVLTSMDDDDLKDIGIGKSTNEQVVRLAKLSAESGLDGVVCSAHEAAMIKENCSNDFLCVTPGIRLDQSHQDQKRVMTPKAAIQQGANYLVIGRAITQASNPMDILEKVNKDLAG